MKMVATSLPQDKVIANMLLEVLPALDELGASYTLGGESLLGFSEGDITKYKSDIHLYLFKLPLIKKFILFIMLLRKGIILKPKPKWGHHSYKLRSPQIKGKQKHPYVIKIIPVQQQGDTVIVHAGGHTNSYDYQDFNGDNLDRVEVEGTLLTIPQNLNTFVSKYRKQLLAESYKQNKFHFTPTTRKHAHILLRSSCEILEDMGIHYWLDFGTLLGLIRENKLIDWDKDMDLSVRFESEEKMEQMISALGKHHPVKTLPPSVRPGIWKLGRYRTVKTFHQKYGLIRTEPHLDFFTQYRGLYENQSEPTYRSVIAGLNNEIPASFVDELDSFQFEGHEYAIPNHAEDFLALRYGADWRTPKSDWSPAFDDVSMVKSE
ncbi:MAG: LicD family protein [Candidatus Marinimicrobia bacterium]|nr:LicD family protein [Candidatus Neomarinimicrobiota bacterium]